MLKWEDGMWGTVFIYVQLIADDKLSNGRLVSRWRGLNEVEIALHYWNPFSAWPMTSSTGSSHEADL